MSKSYEFGAAGKYVFHPVPNIGSDHKGHCMVDHIIGDRRVSTARFEWFYWDGAWLWKANGDKWSTPDPGVIDVLEHWRRDVLNEAADEVLLDEST